MSPRIWLVFPLAAAVGFIALPHARSCCPAPPKGGKMPVVNADQSVIIIWDAEKKEQHFIRRASFKSAANDFGFLVPSPTQPKLSESGDEAFPTLYEVTKPEVITKKAPSGGGGCTIGCSDEKKGAVAKDKGDRGVRVLDEVANVAGFEAKVLEAKSARGLVDWLKEHEYAYSPEIEAWAKPYVEKGWIITALKVAKKKEGKSERDVNAQALRMTFKTDRPLFPYREPDYKGAAATLGATSRLLRIYFIADARYEGELTKEQAWTGKPVWSGKMKDEAREKVLGQLKLDAAAGPKEWWLTEFEDPWPYAVAPADVYFSKSGDQGELRRKPVIQYVSTAWPGDVTMYALAVAMFAPVLLRRLRKKESA